MLLLLQHFGIDFHLKNHNYGCTEDPDIHCFPLAIPPTTNLDLNISRNATPEITNCSMWTTGDISPYVTFRCFKCVNDLQIALAALGGLLSIFKIAIKLVFALLLFITRKSIIKNEQQFPSEKRKKCFKCLRICIALLLAAAESSFGIVIGVAYAKHWLSIGTLADHKSTLYKVFEILNEPLVVIGVVTTALLLPLENYATISGEQGYEIIDGGDTELQRLT